MAEITLEEAPRKARDLYQKGVAAIERGNNDYAIDMLTQALEIEPRLLRARRYLRAAEVKKFKDKKGGQITHVITTITGLPQLLIASGSLKKKPEQALKSAEKLMRQDPLNMQFINLLTQSALASEMPEVAIQTLEIAKEFYSSDHNLLNRLGQIYLDVGDTRNARQCFDEVVKLRPNDMEAVKRLKDATAMDTMNKGGWETAESYRDVIKDTEEATRLEQSSKAVKSSKDIDDLITDTKEKIKQEPENINYRRSLADLYTRDNRYEEAISVLDEVREMGVIDPQIDLLRNQIQVKHFDYQINKLRENGDEDTAKAKEKEKDEFLMADARDRVKRYPNDLQFRFELGVLLFEHGELNEAIQHLQRAQRNPQKRIRALYYLALCFKQKEQSDIAIEQLEKAASELHTMDNTKKDILYELGELHELTGNVDKAAEFFKEIYAVDISYRDVSERIENIYKQQKDKQQSEA